VYSLQRRTASVVSPTAANRAKSSPVERESIGFSLLVDQPVEELNQQFHGEIGMSTGLGVHEVGKGGICLNVLSQNLLQQVDELRAVRSLVVFKERKLMKLDGWAELI